MEGCVAYLEGHTCGLCMHLLGPITIFEHILGGPTWKHFLLFLEIYILLFHGVLAWSKP
jgi:hypothetical protein